MTTENMQNSATAHPFDTTLNMPSTISAAVDDDLYEEDEEDDEEEAEADEDVEDSEDEEEVEDAEQD